MCVSGVIGVASVLVSIDADDDAQDMIGPSRVYKSSGSSNAGTTSPDVDDVADEITTGKTASHSSHDASKRSGATMAMPSQSNPNPSRSIVGHHFPRYPPSSSFASSSRYLRTTSAMFSISSPTAAPPRFVLVLVIVFVFFLFVGAQRSLIHISNSRGRVFSVDRPKRRLTNGETGIGIGWSRRAAAPGRGGVRCVGIVGSGRG